jgi:hypothetical protein
MVTDKKSHSIFKRFSKDQIALLEPILSFKKNIIYFDLDQVLSNTEEPVMAEFDRRVGTNYLQQGRKIDQWRSLQAWAVDDKKLPKDDAYKLESELWTDSSTLNKALPYKQLKLFSMEAQDAKVEQGVVSSRIYELLDDTLEWIRLHYPWIPKRNIYSRSKKESQTKGAVFKADILTSVRPDVYFEDDMYHIEILLKRTDKFPIVYFPRKMDVGKIKDNRVIEFTGGISEFGLLYKYMK